MSEETTGYQHISTEVLAQATRETLARLELEDHTIRMQAVIANDPNPVLANGEPLEDALARLAETKARVERAYAHLLVPPNEEGTADGS